MIKSQYFKKYRYNAKKSIFKNRFFRLFILFLIFFIIIFYLVCFYSFFQIKNIEISGNQKISTQDLKNLAENNLSKKILFLPSKSIFLVDLNKIEKEILDKFPPIKKVYFEKKFPDKLTILINERQPAAILEENEKYYFIDNEGILFEEITEKGSWLIIKNSTSSQEVKLGEKILEQEKLSDILEIKSGLKDLDIKVEFAEIVNEKRVDVRTLDGWSIYFNLEDDISQQIFYLKTVLKEKISPEERRNLEYVDLRFGNQIYYRER